MHDVHITTAHSRLIDTPRVAEIVAKFVGSLERQAAHHKLLEVTELEGGDVIAVDGTIHLAELAADLTDVPF